MHGQQNIKICLALVLTNSGATEVCRFEWLSNQLHVL